MKNIKQELTEELLKRREKAGLATDEVERKIAKREIENLFWVVEFYEAKVLDMIDKLEDNDHIYKKSTHFLPDRICECNSCERARNYNDAADSTVKIIQKDLRENLK